MLTSETLQIFVLLSDLSKIPDVRILYSLKKGLNWKRSPPAHSTSWKFSTWWKLGLHFVFIFTADWKFLTKFCSSDPSCNRNILISLYFKSETSAHGQLRNYSFIRTIYKFHDMVSVGNLHRVYPFIYGVCRQRHECGHVTFPRKNFWCATFY